MPHPKTQADVDHALVALIENNRSPRRAARALKKAGGFHVGEKALRDWLQDPARMKRLEQLERELGPQMRREAERGWRAVSAVARETLHEILERLQREHPELEPKELAATAQRLATVGGIAEDKASVLAGDVSTVVHVSADQAAEALRALAQRGLATADIAKPSTAKAIEGSADEVGD